MLNVLCKCTIRFVSDHSFLVIVHTHWNTPATYNAHAHTSNNNYYQVESTCHKVMGASYGCSVWHRVTADPFRGVGNTRSYYHVRTCRSGPSLYIVVVLVSPLLLASML